MTRRRNFLGQIAAAVALPAHAKPAHASFPDVLRSPDRVSIYSASGRLAPEQAKRVSVVADPTPTAGVVSLPITVRSPEIPLSRVCLRWQGALSGNYRFLADHWERSYGDLEWRASVPNRVMPWYFLATDGRLTHGVGVKTGCSAFCFWQADPEGISLWLDLRNGGSPVELGQRRLHAVTVVTSAGESPFSTARELCRRLCDRPRLPAAPIYGGNNWYYTYGNNFTAPDILRDSDLLAELAGLAEPNRPFMVIDMGWSRNPDGAGPVDVGNAGFPDMPGLASQMKSHGVRPGIWLRPLLTTETLSPSWLLPANRSSESLKPGFSVLDPSVPEALDHIRASLRTVHNWGYELIKHDFSTFDILGRWGFQMAADLTNANWHFFDRTRTSAEIIRALYEALRSAAGDSLLLGCNTVGHLSAGLFEAQRIGDDTSGREWERTRKMGVNTLAFRLPQHNTFFAADADCVPITPRILWEFTRQWLDLVARSGTPLFISVDPKTITLDQKEVLKKAFSLAARTQSVPEPLDWLESTAPEQWRFGSRSARYRWYEGEGASPFAK